VKSALFLDVVANDGGNRRLVGNPNVKREECQNSSTPSEHVRHRRNTIVAWSALLPSSPAPSARRCAASGLDLSIRPSAPADDPAGASFSIYRNENRSSQTLAQDFDTLDRLNPPNPTSSIRTTGVHFAPSP
jgi:hypothetical protein